MAVQPAGPAPANAVLGPNSTEEEWFNDFAQRMYNAVGRDPTNPAHNLVGSGDQGSLDMLANGVALAAADDSYPFSAQFNPDDDCGLFWDPNDEFTSYDVGGLADFDPFLNPAIWGN